MSRQEAIRLLQLNDNYTKDELNDAYEKLIEEYNPDHQEEKNREIFQKLYEDTKEAYVKLGGKTNKKKRKRKYKDKRKKRHHRRKKENDSTNGNNKQNKEEEQYYDTATRNKVQFAIIILIIIYLLYTGGTIAVQVLNTQIHLNLIHKLFNNNKEWICYVFFSCVWLFISIFFWVIITLMRGIRDNI